MGISKTVASLLLVVTCTTGCFPDLPPVPTKGYGAPYIGIGKPIYTHDARGGWEIAEGGKKITSEQALEATKDEEYEIRRQEAKKYNEKIFAEGETHRFRGKVYLGTGIAAAVVGFAVALVVPTGLRGTSTTAATATDPEVRVVKPGGASSAVLAGGLVVGIGGIALAAYGVIAGKEDPPYHVWKTPKDLDKAEYVREKAEKYNEDLGAPPVEDQPGAVEDIPLAPGQRKPPPPRPGATPKPGAAPATSGKPGAAPPPATSAKPGYPSSLGNGRPPPVQPVAPAPRGGR